MPYFLKSSLIAVTSLAVLAGEASAQYYNPAPAPQSYAHQPGGLGLDLGLRNGGFNPNVGAGIGQVGAGVGAGIGRNGLGLGANTGIGPIGASVDSGLSGNGLGLRAASGIGNTGAAFDGGVSGGGVGLGGSAKLFGFGAGVSAGVGQRSPGFGTSLAFGPLGTLLIGSHRNSYPGAQQTAAYTYPNQNAAYYTPQSYGNSSYYRTAPVVHPVYHAAPVERRVYAQPVQARQSTQCPTNWTC